MNEGSFFVHFDCYVRGATHSSVQNQGEDVWSYESDRNLAEVMDLNL